MAATAGAVVATGAAVQVLKSDSNRRPDAFSFAAVSSLVFASQMVNFPIAGGTSGHLVFAVLACGLLGLPAGFLSVAAVLTLQAVFFADGGLMALGANILNIAGVACVIVFAGRRLLPRFPPSPAWYGLMAWIAVVIGSTFASIEIAASGTASFASTLTNMVSTHLGIGMVEGLATFAVLRGVRSAESVVVFGHRTYRCLLIPIGVLCLIAPWASQKPDGLASVAEQGGFTTKAVESVAAQFALAPDYVVLGMEGWLGTQMAALFGVLLITLYVEIGLIVVRRTRRGAKAAY